MSQSPGRRAVATAVHEISNVVQARRSGRPRGRVQVLLARLCLDLFDEVFECDLKRRAPRVAVADWLLTGKDQTDILQSHYRPPDRP